MKTANSLFFFVLFGLLGLMPFRVTLGAPGEKPNVIVVITDDQGYGDLGCHGNPYIRTPHLDRFKEESVSFSNFHVSTTCAPTRGALMTGRHTNRLNVYHTIAGRSLLYEDELILPQIYSQNGYACGMFGKWHLGDNYPFRPEDRGFHEVVRHGGGGIGQMPDYWGNDYFDDTYWHNGEMEKYEGYCTDVFFSEAIRFIEENRKAPFFCYISTNAPHSPLNVPESYLDLYREKNQIPEKQKRFYAMITNIDDNFKRLLDHLDRLGLSQNTLLLFMTDNGTAAGHLVYDAGLRGNKGSEYEGGHRVPLMLRWPQGNLAGGRELGQLVAHYDLLPTLVDLSALSFSPNKPLDGISLKPLLRGDTANWPNRILYMDTQRLQNLVKYRKYSVMEEEWRLVNGDELYYLKEDLGQNNNLFDQYPEVVERLAAGYESWWNSILAEGVDERYAYIKVGSDRENPVRICSHDLLTAKHGAIWHQNGAVKAAQATGRWKVEVTEAGEYLVRLRRFPEESGLSINAKFPEEKRSARLEKSMPASNNVGFREAYLYLADFAGTKEIEEGAKELDFRMTLSAGKFDMEAQLVDELGRRYPAYYVYIEKL